MSKEGLREHLLTEHWIDEGNPPRSADLVLNEHSSFVNTHEAWHRNYGSCGGHVHTHRGINE